MKRVCLLNFYRGLAAGAALLAVAGGPALAAAPTLKQIRIFVEGDSSGIPKFVNLCRQKGPERGLDFKFVDRKEDPYEYRVVISSEGSGLWSYAHGNLVVLNPEAKVLFTVTRSGRLTAKGAASALSKEFVKVLARYLGTHK